MKKIGVISDVHGNLQALQVVLHYLKQQNCNEIIHTGDIVDIGAQSRSCLQLLLENNVQCVLGNHDIDFLQNSWQHKPFSHVSSQHKQFVFESLEGCQQQMKQFPLFLQRVCGGKRVIFEHYCRNKNSDVQLFKPIVHNPTAEIFDEMYRDYHNCDAVFFGHKHEPCDIVGERLYVDIGSVGCHPQALACGIVICYDDNHFHYTRFSLPYNQAETQALMTQSNLPDGKYLFDFYYLHKKEMSGK